jgi:hypothetical protein
MTWVLVVITLPLDPPLNRPAGRRANRCIKVAALNPTSMRLL